MLQLGDRDAGAVALEDRLQQAPCVGLDLGPSFGQRLRDRRLALWLSCTTTLEAQVSRPAAQEYGLREAGAGLPRGVEATELFGRLVGRGKRANRGSIRARKRRPNRGVEATNEGRLCGDYEKQSWLHSRIVLETGIEVAKGSIIRLSASAGESC